VFFCIGHPIKIFRDFRKFLDISEKYVRCKCEDQSTSHRHATESVDRHGQQVAAEQFGDSPQTRAQVIELASQLGYRSALHGWTSPSRNERTCSPSASSCSRASGSDKRHGTRKPGVGRNERSGGMPPAPRSWSTSSLRDRDRCWIGLSAVAMREGKLSGLSAALLPAGNGAPV